MPKFKDNYKATPVKCSVDVSSKSNPTYEKQQEGKKKTKGKDGEDAGAHDCSY